MQALIAMRRTTVIRLLVTILTIPTLLALGAPTAMASPPPNDDFDQATVVSALPFTNELDTTEASSALDDPTDCFGVSGEKSVWYVYTPSHDLKVQVDTYGSEYETYITAYTGVRGSLSFVPPCSASSGGLLYSRLFVSLTEGVTYYIEISGGAPAGGQFRFNVHDISQPAVNDDITNAVPVGTFPFTDGSNTIAATRDLQDPVCADYQGQTVWYSFTPDTTMRVYATSLHSIYENALSVYSSPTASPLVLKEVACSPGFPEVYFDAKAGMTYFLMVSALAPVGEESPLAQGGFLNLLVQEAFRITEFTVDPKATVNGDSTVTLTGTVACNHLLGAVQISGSMAQRGVEGSFDILGVRCGESTARWSATVASPTTKRFVPGVAEVKARAFGFHYGLPLIRESPDQVTRRVPVTLGPPSQ
jgi:hypothetical protein